MKILLFFALVFTSLACSKSVEVQDELTTKVSNSYEGYYLKSLQINEDSTYRISLFDGDRVVVILSVQASKIEFRNNDTINAVYREVINGSYTGKYIIRLKSDFKIAKYYI